MAIMRWSGGGSTCHFASQDMDAAQKLLLDGASMEDGWLELAFIRVMTQHEGKVGFIENMVILQVGTNFK